MTSISARFGGKYIPVPESGCWLWLGYTEGHGYGHLLVSGVFTPAHRVSWELYKGLIPPGLLVRHKCDTRSCVNPDHLELGTAKDNSGDMCRRKRQAHGTRNGSARLTPEQVAAIRADTGTYKETALRHGTTRSHVWNIKHGKKWRENA